MKISSVNTLYSFGRTPLMTCMIKKSGNKEKVSATLYKMDANDTKDIDDIRFSKRGRCLYNGILSDFKRNNPVYDFYMLQDDKTKEVISCAQTSHHFRTSEQNPGFSTLVDEMDLSPNYINGAEPLLAYIALNAANRYDSSVYTAFHPEDINLNLKQMKFSSGNQGEWFIPEKRYLTLIDKAQAHSQIEFLNKDNI